MIDTGHLGAAPDAIETDFDAAAGHQTEEPHECTAIDGEDASAAANQVPGG